jgi:hypothetical protein
VLAETPLALFIDVDRSNRLRRLALPPLSVRGFRPRRFGSIEMTMT